MADNFSQGTVAPFLPLRAQHLTVLAMISDCLGELPDGVERVDAAVELTNQDLFDAWAEQYEEMAEGALEEAKAGMLRILESGEETMGDLAAVHYADDPDLVGSAGEKLYYLYSEEGFGGWALEFLSWVIQDMPEQIRFITFEYACTCSKMRPGEFGGGAWFIHRGGVEVLNTGSWLHEMEELLRRREGSPGDVMDLMSQLAAVETTTLTYPRDGADRYVRDLLARAAAFMQDEGDVPDDDRAALLRELLDASANPEDPDRCVHGMFFGGAGACPQCGGGAE